MTIEAMKEKVNENKEALYWLEYKDHWTHADWNYYFEKTAEIAELQKKIAAQAVV